MDILHRIKVSGTCRLGIFCGTIVIACKVAFRCGRAPVVPGAQAMLLASQQTDSNYEGVLHQ